MQMLICLLLSLFISVSQSCPTICHPMDCSTPGFPVHHQLPELAQTHVHRAGWSHPTISLSVVPFSSCLQSFPISESFPMSQFFASGGKNWSFSIRPSNEYSGLISFTIDWFDLLSVQGTFQESPPTPQFKSISSLVLSFLYHPVLTSIHDYWKNHSFDNADFVGKVPSLLFIMLSLLLLFFQGTSVF